MKLFVLLPRLDGGGMERMRLNMVPEFQALGAEVYLVIGKIVVGSAPDGVQVIEIARTARAAFFWGLLRVVWKHRPTHILSAGDDVNCMAIIASLLLWPRARIVVSNHNNLSEQIRKVSGVRKRITLLVKMLMSCLYPLADGVVAVSKGVASDLSRQLGLPLDRIKLIYNPIVVGSRGVSMESLPKKESCAIPMILFVGRFVPQKRLDILLDAFVIVVSRRNARLVLVGKGELASWLSRQILSLGLSDMVELRGFIEDVLPIMAQAEVLVLPSDYEGLGNVLVEAMSCGTQVVATDCPSGPAEVLEEGKYGQLVPTGDPVALAEAILAVLDGRKEISPDVLRGRAAEFSASRAAASYFSLLRGGSF